MTHEANAMMHDSGRRLRKGERTRRHVLQVAAELFAEQGYAATTYDDLVSASGLSRGGFYFHFRTKEDLAIAVIDTKQRQWEQELRSRLNQLDSPTRRLAAFAPVLFQMQVEDPSGLALTGMTAELTRVPALADQARAVAGRWTDLLSQLVSDSQEEGGIRSDLDADSLATVLIASMTGIRQVMSHYPADDRRSSLELHQATWMTIVRQGLKSPTDLGRPVQGRSGPA